MLGAGLAAAAAGVILVAIRSTPAAYAADAHLYAGGSVLTLVRASATSTLYDGDAAYLLTTAADGSIVGRAAWHDREGSSSGACVMRRVRALLIETCRFASPSATTTSVDSYDLTSGEWQRTYADGEQTTIRVPAGYTVVPVPFPLGR